MAFWDNVAVELEYQGLTNKFLAEKVGFAASNITKGIQCKSSPSADTAVKIAKILGVSVEYLVNGTDTSISSKIDDNLIRYHKYADFLDNIEALPEYERKSIIELVSKLRKGNESIIEPF